MAVGQGDSWLDVVICALQGFHSSVSPGGFECSSDTENNVKKVNMDTCIICSSFCLPVQVTSLLYY